VEESLVEGLSHERTAVCLTLTRDRLICMGLSNTVDPIPPSQNPARRRNRGAPARRRITVGLSLAISALVSVGCSGPGTPAPPQPSPSPKVTGLHECPWAGGDAAISSGTTIRPAVQGPRAGLNVLASTITTRGTTVRAVVRGDGHRPAPSVLVSSYIVLAYAAYSLESNNVIATSARVRTIDTDAHPLTLRVPAGLSPGRYLVLDVQNFTPQCHPLEDGQTVGILGTVRITR
jgi:hypothetical protein